MLIGASLSCVYIEAERTGAESRRRRVNHVHFFQVNVENSTLKNIIYSSHFNEIYYESSRHQIFVIGDDADDGFKLSD